MSEATYIISGLSDLLNKENIKPDIDVGEIERKMISNGFAKESVTNNVDRFDQEIDEIVSKLGISFNDVDSYSTSNNSYSTSNNSNSTSNNNSYSTSNNNSYSAPNNNSNSHEEPVKYDQYHIDFEEETPSYAKTELDERTYEEQKRNHINNVLGSTTQTDIDNFSLDKEREEDEKCAMLAEIDYLLDSLKDEGVDISRIPKVDDSNDSKSIEKILKVLRHKVDHARYCTFAEEFMLSGAHGLEYLFDGKNMWFGRWNPDLTGWHVHVNRKLRRMRTDTGKIVSHVMNDYDIGPFMRVCLELIPSMFLFSKKRSEQNGLSTYNLDKDMSRSINELKDL
jgi:hypothetical protein